MHRVIREPNVVENLFVRHWNVFEQDQVRHAEGGDNNEQVKPIGNILGENERCSLCTAVSCLRAESTLA